MAYGSAGAWQSGPVDRKIFVDSYCRIMYPGISELMSDAFKKMSESEDLLAACFGRHTLSEMWEDPFSAYHLKNTALHIDDLRIHELQLKRLRKNFLRLSAGEQRIALLSEQCSLTADNSAIRQQGSSGQKRLSTDGIGFMTPDSKLKKTMFCIMI